MNYRQKTLINPITSIILVTAACFIVFTSSQMGTQMLEKRRPEKCVGHPDLLMRFCCALPPFFTSNVSRTCGGAMEKMHDAYNVSKLRRYSYSCRYWYCVLDQYGLIERVGNLDHEKFFSHLDLWVTLNPSFTDVMIEAKLRCKQLFRYYFPLRVCDFFKLSMCFRNYINVNCPVLLPIDGCAEQRQFYQECGIYFT